MARRATKDTFGFETAGDVEIRRKVVAGQLVPDNIAVDEGVLEEESSYTPAGYRTGQATQRVTVEGEITNDHREKSRTTRKHQDADRTETVDNNEEKAADAAQAAHAAIGHQTDVGDPKATVPTRGPRPKTAPAKVLGEAEAPKK